MDATEMPLCGMGAWWVTAWLAGLESTDETLDRLGQGGRLGADLPGGPGSGVDLLAFLRREGVRSAGLALARDGELLGLGGPPGFNHAAIDAGGAIVAGPYGLVPVVVGDAVHWQVHPAARRQLPDLREATQGLRLALLAAADGLAALDVARWNPDVADALINLRHVPALAPPAGTPPECGALAARALQAIHVVDLALGYDGGAVSAYEIDRRRALLAPLGSAGRRALVAACSPEVWPPAAASRPGG